MDRLSLAEAALAAAASRNSGVVVPGSVTSPMDCCRTVPVSREVVDGCADRARHVSGERDAVGYHALAVDLVVGDGSERTGELLDAEMVRLAGREPPAAGTRTDKTLSA